ncbi:hypothetical protein [Desulfomicrobium orale]|uniref:hypothetical protein n=1 Tax=Desulfomicrobium orale TaxID=132132 RepID=UPI001B80BCFA|nr:hypothetical protein [Desulfomicrobium orale]
MSVHGVLSESFHIRKAGWHPVSHRFLILDIDNTVKAREARTDCFRLSWGKKPVQLYPDGFFVGRRKEILRSGNSNFCMSGHFELLFFIQINRR